MPHECGDERPPKELVGVAVAITEQQLSIARKTLASFLMVGSWSHASSSLSPSYTAHGELAIELRGIARIRASSPKINEVELGPG
jgi:hypothetical protein